MRWISVWATVSIILLVLGSSRTASIFAPVVKLAAYHIVKKPIHTVSDKFLSFTADPNTISRVAECLSEDGNTTLKMAKTLTPAYFRIAGVDSNRLRFQSNPNANNSDNISKSKIFPVTNSDWLKWNNFLSKTGMKVIACVSGETEASSKGWDLSNILELITFSDNHNISLDWQLGYELQKLASPQGKLMGRDVERLRKILDLFPRYRESLIIGPDMTNFRTQGDAAFIKNYLAEAKDSLDVFTWHPFSKISEESEILKMLSNGMISMDNHLWIKDGFMKSSSKGVAPRKPIWIAESENTGTVSNLSDSMTWIMRMGSAARLGASVYLRRPHLLSFYEPTPEYWIAILYKSLVGKTVLDIKRISENDTNNLQMFTHCTRFIEKPEESIINPEILYDPGSITVYGINMASESTRISFKIGYKADETAHLYILTEDTGGNFPKTLMNKQLLNLSPDNELPIISPRVRESPKYVLIPAHSIFFIVFPNTKCRSCNEFDTSNASKFKIKVAEEEDQETNTFAGDILEATDDENDHDKVNFPTQDESSQIPSDSNPLLDNSNLKLGTKFVISSEDTWMNRFPQELKDVIKKENDPFSNVKDKEKAQQYRILAQAMTGKRAIQNTPTDFMKSENPATRFVYEEERSESMQSKRMLKNSDRIQRSLKSAEVNETEPKELLPQNDFQMKELINDDFLEQNHENSPIPIQNYPMKIDNQNIVLYLYDQPDNESQCNETEKSHTHSAIYAVPLYEENFEEAMNISDFKDAVPIITFVKMSTLEGIIEAANDRIKRETSIGKFTISEVPSSSNSYLTEVSSSQKSTMDSRATESTIKEVARQIADLVAKLFTPGSLPQTPQNGLFNLMNHTQNYDHIFSQVLLNEGGFLKLPENSSVTGDSTTGFIQKEDLELDKFQQALKEFSRFKRWAESIPENALGLKKSSFNNNNNNNQMEVEQNIMKQDDQSSSTNLESSMNPNLQNMALYVNNQENGEFEASKSEKRSTLSKISAIPLNKESLQEAIEGSEFRETIPILTFLPKSTLKTIVKAANNRKKRETRQENSTNNQVFDDSTKSSTTPPPSSNSLIETTTQPITSQSLLKEEKELSIDIVEEVDKIMKQLIQNNTENQSNLTQKLNLQQTNSSVSDLVKESDDSKVQRELRKADDNSEVHGNALGGQKPKTKDKTNFRPVSPFPKKPKHARSKSAKNKGKSDNSVQLNHLDPSITSLPEADPVLSSKHQIGEISSPSPAKSSNLIKTSKSTDESEGKLPSFDSVTATKSHSETSENLQEPIEVIKDPHKEFVSKVEAPHFKNLHSEDSTLANLQESIEAAKAPHKGISPKIEAPHFKKLHPEEFSVVKQIPTEKDNSFKLGTHTPSKLSTTVRKPLLRPATLSDIEKESAKHHKTPEQLQASIEQKKKELQQKYSDRLKEIQSLLSSLALPTPHTNAKRSADIIDDARDAMFHMWDGLQHWEPSKDWEAGKSWITKESKVVSDMITKRNRRHIKENTKKQPSDVFKNNGLKRNIDLVFPHSYHENASWNNEASRNYMQTIMDEINQHAMKVMEERKKVRSFPILGRNDTLNHIKKSIQWKEKSRAAFEEHLKKLSKPAKELKKKRSGHTSCRNERNIQTTSNKIQELSPNKYQQIDPYFPVEQLEIPSKLATNLRPIKPTSSRNKRAVQTIQNKIQELRQKKQECPNSLHKKSKVDHPPPNGNLESFSSQTPHPIPHKNLEVRHISSDGHLENSSQTPLLSTNMLQNKVPKIDEPLHQVKNKTSKKLHKSAPAKRDKFHHSLHKRDTNENQMKEKVTSPAESQKNFHFHLFADAKLNTPQSMLEDFKYDDFDRIERSLNDNEISETDDKEGITLKNKDPEVYHELKLNKVNDFVLEPVISTSKPSIDIKISKGNSRFRTYEVKATSSSQENQSCQLSYNLFKYFWCCTEKFWNTFTYLH